MRKNSEKKVQMSHWRAGKRLKSERARKEPEVAGGASVAAINLRWRNKVGDEIRRRKKEESA